MKRLVLFVCVLSLCSALALASETDFALQDNVAGNAVTPMVGEQTDYSPQLEIQFQHFFTSQSQSITCDGSYYYAIGYNAGCETYELDGTYVQQVTIGFNSVRSIMWNPVDGICYCKPFGLQLYTVDPSNGNTVELNSNFYNDANSCAFLWDNYIYEYYNGTLWKIDIATGNVVETTTGFTGYAYPVATNGMHVFTIESSGGLVHAWEFDATFYEDFTLQYGDWSWALSHTYATTNYIWLADRSSGGYWYGYSGVEGGPPPDTCFRASFDIRTPYVPSVGGNIMFELSVQNCGALDLPLYGEIIPTIGDCVGGTQVPMGLNRMLQNVLPAGQTYSNGFFYPIVNVAPMNLSTCAIWFKAGPAVGNWYDEQCDEFEFCNPWLRSGEVEWGDNWYEIGDNGNIPSATGLNQNYPNPFNATTGISFDLATAGEVTLDVFNVAGQKVATLADGYYVAGTHTVDWNASAQASGVYFYKLSTGDNVFTKRMTLLK
jgi:hypothetical protein